MASDTFSDNVRIKGIQPSKKTNIITGRTGKIEFARKTFIAGGTVIKVENGVCTFYTNFSCNIGCFTSYTEKITFGDDHLSGCYVNARDSGGYTIILNDIEQISSKSVEIGKDVWIVTDVGILKGVTIDDVSIVGYRSCATRNMNEEHCVTAGYPARVARRGVDWKE